MVNIFEYKKDNLDDITEGFLKKWTEVGGEIRGLLL